MLRVLGSEKRLCDGISRRELMRVGGLSLFGGLNWSPADFVATIYQLMGIDPHQTVPDRSARLILIAHGGEPVVDIIG